MHVIGLMSGTSADGVDVALCAIEGEPGSLSAKIVCGETYPFDSSLRQRTLDACDVGKSRIDQITQLHYELGGVFANCVLRFLESNGLSPIDVDLIGSHGQTLWHNVLPDGAVEASLQIAEAAVLAERTGITTISNFRARDIAAGGQGAPLTAYVDWLLLRHPEHWRAIQNIGGMGNVTFLPPLNDTESAPVAFDTGPGNAMLDVAVGYFTGGAQTFDRDGRMAMRGRVNEEWLDALLRHPYYQREYPKTTGRETFGTEAALELIAQAEARGLTSVEIIATLTALTATNIADAYARFAPAPITEAVLGGGGRHNPVMVGLLRELLAPAQVISHDDIGMDGDFKEALVFAVLAHESWHNRPGTMPALTGARIPAVLGQITPGTNFGELVKRTWRHSAL